MSREMPLVSVIIPAYNTEEYIEEMLNCTIHQTYKNIEIIVIDDGSTDGTKDVVKKLQKTDKRVILIENNRGGVSVARNTGINIARGEKLFFWDSDDIIESTAIEKVLRFSQEKDFNAVVYGWANYVDGDRQEPFIHELNNEYRGAEVQNSLIPHFIGHSFQDINEWIAGKKGLRQGKELTALWHVMTDSGTIKKYNIRFDPTLSLGEDTKLINTYLLYENSVGFLDECFYYLRRRMNGANMTSISNPLLMKENKLKLIDARKCIDKRGEEIGLSTHHLWEGTMVFSAVELAVRLSKNRNAKEIINRKAYQEYISNKDVADAIFRFKPEKGWKSIPFIVLKRNDMLLYYICRVIPQKLICRITG